jgi:bifunctional non-homologous end joining protein LigD
VAKKTAAKRKTAKRAKRVDAGTRARSPARRSTAKSASAKHGEDEIAGVRVTHPDRVLFPGQGVTKRELIDYYLAVADRMLPHVAGRPLALVRCPRGSGAQCFFQKHANPGWPDAFKHVRIREKSGTDSYLYIEDERGLVAAVQMGVLELHLWGATAAHVEQPDRLVFDLDPDEDLPFAAVIKASLQLKKILEDIDLAGFAMATGGKGLHIVVPLLRGHTWDQHRDFAEAMAKHMAAEAPDRFVATMSKTKRRGKIFIDYLRNTRGASAIAPYSTRARPGAHVAFPLSWPAVSKLEDARPAAVSDAAGKLARMKDPWPGYFKLRQTLPRL